MNLLHVLLGEPTQEDWERVKVVRSYKTWKLYECGGIGVDAAEIAESKSYKDAIRQARKVGLTALFLPYCWAKFYVRVRRKVLKLGTDEQLFYLLSLGVLGGSLFRRLLRESIEHRIRTRWKSSLTLTTRMRTRRSRSR